MSPDEIAKIIKDNPDIDPASLARVLEVLRQLREAGLPRGQGYGISLPYTRPLQQTFKKAAPGTK